MHRSWMERGSFEPRDLHPSFNRQDLKPYVEHLNEKSGKHVSPLCVYGGPVLLVFIIGMLVVFLGDDLFKSCKQVEDSSFDSLYPDVFNPPAAAATRTPFAEVFTANGRATTVWVTATATSRAGGAPGAAATQTAVAGAAAPALAPAAAAATGAAAPVTPATSANPASPANAQPANAQPANTQPGNTQPENAQPVNPPAASPDAVTPVAPKPVAPKPTPPVAPTPPSRDKSTPPPDTGNWVTGRDDARGLPDTSRCPTDVWSPDYQPCLAAVNWEWEERHGLHFKRPRRLRRAASQPQLADDEITTVMAATANAKTYHEECEQHPLPRFLIAFVCMLVTAAIAALVERSDLSDARDAAEKAVDDLNKRSAGSQLRWSYGEDKKTIITTHVHNGFATTSKQTRKYPVVQLYAITPPPQVVVVQQQRSEESEEERLNAGIARLASVASSAGVTRLSSIGEPSRVASVGSSSSYGLASSAAASHAPSSSVAAPYAPSSSGSSSTLVAPPAAVATPAPYAPPEAYYQAVLKVRPTAVPQPSWATTQSESATSQPAPPNRPTPITEPESVAEPESAQPASATRPLSEHDMAPPYSEVWEKENR
ncbi:hypothetical protein HDU88_004340 [Geranomyces variabilis]|nr:hypothetical protein HDU88_004340 [Geranomyces variabilis]